MSEEGETQEVELDQVSSAEEITEAKSLGWADADRWRGDPKQWVDAKTFLEKGRPVLGVLKQNNERLQGELAVTRGELTKLQGALQAATASIEALHEAHDEDVKEQVEAARKELKAEITRASREGDHEGLAEATMKLGDLNAAESEARTKEAETAAVKKPDTFVVPTEIQAWYQANPDFVSNPRKVALANVIAAEMRANGETATGAIFMDKLAKEVDETLGTTRRGGPGRVSGGNGGVGRTAPGNGGGKTYADLPADAKAVCDRQATRLVGDNRLHKTVESWRASYARQFFKE